MKFNKLFVIFAITLITMATMIRIRRSETDTEADRKKKSKDPKSECFVKGTNNKDVLITREAFNEAHKDETENLKKSFDTWCNDQEGYVAPANAKINTQNVTPPAAEGKKK